MKQPVREVLLQSHLAEPSHVWTQGCRIRSLRWRAARSVRSVRVRIFPFSNMTRESDVATRAVTDIGACTPCIL